MLIDTHSHIDLENFEDHFDQVIETAKEYGFVSCNFNTNYLPLAVEYLRGTGIKVGCGCDYPFGGHDTLIKAYEAKRAAELGADELDVVMTKGITTLVCSCKTSKMCKEHLYEIESLARRFSVKSKPVIIYSSDQSIENGEISNNTNAVIERAKEMGVYLIDKDIFLSLY